MNPITYAAAAIIGGLLIAVGALTMRTHNLETDLATEKLQNSIDRAAAAEAAASATQAYREREKHWTDAMQEADRATQKVVTQSRADAAAADSVGRSLRERAAALAARSCPAAGAASATAEPAPADSAAMVLADLFSRADARAGDLAAIADERGAAGTGCAKAADSIGTRQ